MANSAVEVCNISLNRVGIQKVISSLTEKSTEAKAFNRIYNQMRQEVLSEYAWPFATDYVPLALISTDPNTEWAYCYRYPQSCIRIRKILDPAGRTSYSVTAGMNFPQPQANPSRIPFTLGSDAGGKLVFADMQDAVVEITKDITSEILFSPKFTSALAWKLGAEAGPGIASGDPYKLIAKAEKHYVLAIQNAGNDAFNEIEFDQPPESEYIRSRE